MCENAPVLVCFLVPTRSPRNFTLLALRSLVPRPQTHHDSMDILDLAQATFEYNHNEKRDYKLTDGSTLRVRTRQGKWDKSFQLKAIDLHRNLP